MEQNKTICPYPFLHTHVDARGLRQLCCWSDVQDEHQVEDYWNDDYIKSVRLKMMKGEQIKECHRCYFQESMASNSLRTDELEKYDPAEFTKDCAEDGSMPNGPTWFDYRNRVCNLQCISCGPWLSSTHVILHKKMYGKDYDVPTIDKKTEIELADQIIESIDKRECDRLYWAGGEPMMSNIHWKVMEHLLKVREVDPEYVDSILIEYNSNMTHSKWKGDSIAEMFSPMQPTMRASIDGVEDVFEFLRDGAKWDEVNANIHEYIGAWNNNQQFTIDTVLSAPVLFSFEKYLDYFDQFDVLLRNHRLMDFSGNINTFKNRSMGFIDIRLYPKHIVERVVNQCVHLLHQYEPRGKDRTIEILNSYNYDRQQRDDFFSDQDLLGQIRHMTRKFREPHNLSGMTIDDILKKYDEESYDWYRSFN
jgi:sulfatase maturation enzyme AslB (radical SAM superfamily)